MKKKVNFRLIVIEDVVYVEKLTSELLKLILLIHIPNSKTLSNKSSSLPFNYKINLLLDLGILSKEDIKLFFALAEIRNQFAHNFDCQLISDFKKINGKTWKFLEKKFPDNSDYAIFKNLSKSCTSKLETLLKLHNGEIDFEIEKMILSDFALNIDKVIELMDDNFWNEFKDIENLNSSFENKKNLYSNLLSSFLVKSLLNKREKTVVALNSLNFIEVLGIISRRITPHTLEEYYSNLDTKYDLIFENDDKEQNIEFEEKLKLEEYIEDFNLDSVDENTSYYYYLSEEE